MNEFFTMFLGPLLTLLVGGLMLYYMTTGFANLRNEIAVMRADISKLKEEMIQGNVVTDLFKDHMSNHSHKE